MPSKQGLGTDKQMVAKVRQRPPDRQNEMLFIINFCQLASKDFPVWALWSCHPKMMMANENGREEDFRVLPTVANGKNHNFKYFAGYTCIEILPKKALRIPSLDIFLPWLINFCIVRNQLFTCTRCRTWFTTDYILFPAKCLWNWVYFSVQNKSPSAA